MKHLKDVVLVISPVLILLIASCSGEEKTNTDAREIKKPNIVLLISDDQSWTDYSFMGHKYIQTPKLDKLAEEGLTFTRGYTTAPLCSPALASIATGLYPYQHGIIGNDPVFESENERYSAEWRNDRMEVYKNYINRFRQIETIADILGEKGYASLQTGKWWLGNYEYGGFDEGMTHGDPNRGGRHGDEGLKIGRDGLEVIYNFIDSTNAANTPFCVWYAPFLPHAPHTPPDSLKQKYLPMAPTEAVANYWAMCEWFDITCGQIVDYVDQKGLSEETLFVYVTDNGWIQDPDRPNRYAPRSKREPYEMGIRTPIIFNWKGEISPVLDTSRAVSAIDIATTIYGICGIDPPEELQGINVLDNKQLNSRDLIFAETYAHDFSTIDSSLYYQIAIDLPYKLILPDTNNVQNAEIELFNIFSDPFEDDNLVNSNPEIVIELKNEIQAWRSKSE
jgi:arylsulfatase A-like enzyme